MKREEVAHVGPMWKTRLCIYNAAGSCRKSKAACPFAHGRADLRPSPDFERTSVCPSMLNCGRCYNPSCRYAHSKDQLRTAPGLLKSKLCSFFLKGNCVVGEACRFAHKMEELREAVNVHASAKSS